MNATEIQGEDDKCLCDYNDHKTAKSNRGKLTELWRSWIRGVKESKVDVHPGVPGWLSEHAMPMHSNFCPLPAPGSSDYPTLLHSFAFLKELAASNLGPFSTEEELRKQDLKYKGTFYKVKLTYRIFTFFLNGTHFSNLVARAFMPDKFHQPSDPQTLIQLPITNF